jgi:hypothetical protein
MGYLKYFYISVVPAKAETQKERKQTWIPACAGTTKL